MGTDSFSDVCLASVVLRQRVRAVLSRYRPSTTGVVLWFLIGCPSAHAQQANQPGYDPRQTERRFEDQQSSQGANGRPRLPLPQFTRPEGQGNSKPLFALRHVSISGAVRYRRIGLRRRIILTSGRRYRRPISRRSPLRSATSIAPPAFTSAGRSCHRRTSRAAGFVFKSSKAASRS